MHRLKIAVLDDYLNSVRSLRCFQMIKDHDVTVWPDHVQEESELARRLAAAEVLVLIRERTKIDAGLISSLPNLRLISLKGAYPHVDVDACTRRGILVSSDMLPSGPSFATAELTWALILSAMRRLPQQMASLREGRWQDSIGHSLHGKTLGIYGYGRLGQVVAGYGRAFGMKVAVFGRANALAAARADGFVAAASKAELFESADVLSLHLRLVAETRGIVSYAELARMSPTSVFVNTSRAGLVEPGALEAALRSGRPGMAAVDVYDREPLLDRGDSLLLMPNVFCTPHIGYVTSEEFEGQFSAIFGQILAYADGKPINIANPDVLKT